jgi:hypothetical protein
MTQRYHLYVTIYSLLKVHEICTPYISRYVSHIQMFCQQNLSVLTITVLDWSKLVADRNYYSVFYHDTIRSAGL